MKFTRGAAAEILMTRILVQWCHTDYFGGFQLKHGSRFKSTLLTYPPPVNIHLEQPSSQIERNVALVLHFLSNRSSISCVSRTLHMQLDVHCHAAVHICLKASVLFLPLLSKARTLSQLPGIEVFSKSLNAYMFILLSLKLENYQIKFISCCLLNLNN